MRCNNCGKKIEKTSAFCPYCGYNQSLKPVRKKKRWIVLLLLPILVVCSVVFGFIYLIREWEERENYIGMEKGSGLTEEEARELLLSDIPDEDWAVFDETLGMYLKLSENIPMKMDT